MSKQVTRFFHRQIFHLCVINEIDQVKSFQTAETFSENRTQKNVPLPEMRLSHAKALDWMMVGWRSIKNDNIGDIF